jgi:hypothetical protein
MSIVDHARAFVFDLLDEVLASRPKTFVGLGMIFYDAPMRLPVAPLGDQSQFRPALPVRGGDSIARVLEEITQAESPWHDGFHLIDVEANELTHLSQFFAPPLEFIESPRRGAVPSGARHLAAMAGSRIESVSYTAVVSSNGATMVFRRGGLICRTSRTLDGKSDPNFSRT